MSWKTDPDEIVSFRSFGKKIDGNIKPKSVYDSAGASTKRTANKAHAVHRNSSKRREQQPLYDSIEDVFKSGTDDDIRRICSSLDKYDSGHGTYNTTEGFLVKLPDKVKDQERMYNWCTSMGFVQASDTLPVMKLQASKLAVNRFKRDPKSEAHKENSALTFLACAESLQSGKSKPPRKNVSKKCSRMNEPLDHMDFMCHTGVDSFPSVACVIDDTGSGSIETPVIDKDPAPNLRSRAYRISTTESDELSDVSESPRNTSCRSSSNKRKSNGIIQSPSSTDIYEAEGTELVTNTISKGIDSMTFADEGACPQTMFSQPKRLRSNTFGLFFDDHTVDESTHMLDSNGNSLFSPPSSCGPPPIPYCEEFAAAPLTRRKSCRELFDEVAVPSSHMSPPGFPDYVAQQIGEFSMLQPDDPSEMCSSSSRGFDSIASGQHNDEDTEEMAGKRLRRHKTEPYIPPQTPFREQCTSLSQDAVIFTPQPVFASYKSSGAGNYDWGVSETADDKQLQLFYAVFLNRENSLGNKREESLCHTKILRSNAKVKKKKALLRRMSHCRAGLFSPGSSVCKRIKATLKPSLGANCSVEEDEADVDADWNLVDSICHGYSFGVSEEQHYGEHAMNSLSNCMNELTFNGIIVGGVYENCFDGGVPVVSAPSSYDNRVVNVTIECDGSLNLHLYSPNSKSIKIVSLGKNWMCYKTSTGAFLVTKSEIVPHRRMVCYYLPKHPVRWATASSPKDMHDYSLGSIVACDDHEHDRDQSDCDYQGNQSVCFTSAEVENIGNQSSNDATASEPLCRVLITSMDTSVDSESGEFHIRSGATYQSEPTDENSFEQCLILHSEHRMIESDCSFDDSAVLESSSVDWNSPIVASYVCEYLNPEECTVYAAVSRAWALAYFKYRAHQLSICGNCDNFGKSQWIRFMSKYSNGTYLSEGACKIVYQVSATGNNSPSSDDASRWDAISVMDIKDLVDRGVEESISRELEISMVTSSLVSLNISPNFIQVYSVFTSQYPPSPTFWKPAITHQDNIVGCASRCLNSSRNVVSTLQKEASRMSTGNYQYIRMELCSGGDLEDIVRRQSVITPEYIRHFFFQMCFSLYACRERLSMRHYDIKLLNFFCSNASSVIDRYDKHPKTKFSHIRIGFGEFMYYLPLEGKTDKNTDVVKLADFGTSVIGSKTLGCPIGIHQFTTLENTPPEYLMMGSHAREAFSADTFCLGLSFFHLLSGEEPYEEHLKQVHCPAYLQNRLRKIWMTKNASSPYYVIREVIESLYSADDSPDIQDSMNNILYDTLYRYIVLFGLCSTGFDCLSDRLHPYDLENPVWLAIVDSCEEIPHSVKNTKARIDCVRQYNSDRKLWSLEFGEHPIIQRVRHNLELCGDDSMSILMSMVHLDPAQRCSLHDIISSTLFISMRKLEYNADSDHSFVDYLFYKTTPPYSEGGLDTLPIV